MDCFERGDTIVFYHTFLTIEDKEPTSILNPRITIRHISTTNVLITDVNEATMIIVAETTYYYKWVVPNDALIGNYNIEFQAICDGEYQEEDEVIQIID